MQPASPRRRAGVGLALEQATPGTLCYVADIQPGGSAAMHGGAQIGDKILSVDGLSVAGLNLAEVGMRMGGVEGSMVVLGLVRTTSVLFGPDKEEHIEVHLRRGAAHRPRVPSEEDTHPAWWAQAQAAPQAAQPPPQLDYRSPSPPQQALRRVPDSDTYPPSNAYPSANAYAPASDVYDRGMAFQNQLAPQKPAHVPAVIQTVGRGGGGGARIGAGAVGGGGGADGATAEELMAEIRQLHAFVTSNHTNPTPFSNSEFLKHSNAEAATMLKTVFKKVGELKGREASLEDLLRAAKESLDKRKTQIHRMGKALQAAQEKPAELAGAGGGRGGSLEEQLKNRLRDMETQLRRSQAREAESAEEAETAREEAEAARAQLHQLKLSPSSGPPSGGRQYQEAPRTAAQELLEAQINSKRLAAAAQNRAGAGRIGAMSDVDRLGGVGRGGDEGAPRGVDVERSFNM